MYFSRNRQYEVTPFLGGLMGLIDLMCVEASLYVLDSFYIFDGNIARLVLSAIVATGLCFVYYKIVKIEFENKKLKSFTACNALIYAILTAIVCFLIFTDYIEMPSLHYVRIDAQNGRLMPKIEIFAILTVFIALGKAAILTHLCKRDNQNEE